MKNNYLLIVWNTSILFDANGISCLRYRGNIKTTLIYWALGRNEWLTLVYETKTLSEHRTGHVLVGFEGLSQMNIVYADIKLLLIPRYTQCHCVIFQLESEKWSSLFCWSFVDRNFSSMLILPGFICCLIWRKLLRFLSWVVEEQFYQIFSNSHFEIIKCIWGAISHTIYPNHSCDAVLITLQFNADTQDLTSTQCVRWNIHPSLI